MNDQISPSVIAAISKVDANARIAFQRRLTNLEKYITHEINPVEQEIIDLRVKLFPLYDAAKMLRDEAREHCTHSADLIVQQDDGSYKCKFCETVFHVADEIQAVEEVQAVDEIVADVAIEQVDSIEPVAEVTVDEVVDSITPVVEVEVVAEVKATKAKYKAKAPVTDHDIV